MLITSLAVSIFIENLGIMTVTVQPRKFEFPEVFSQIHNAGGVSFSNMTLLTVGSAVFLMLVFTFFIKHTKLGKAMRACSENIKVARLMGIDINIVISTAFAIGSALAALFIILAILNAVLSPYHMRIVNLIGINIALVDVDKVAAIAGFSDSNYALAAGPIAQKAGVPFVTSGATLPSMPEQVGYFFFMAAFGDDARSSRNWDLQTAIRGRKLHILPIWNCFLPLMLKDSLNIGLY